MKSHQSWCSCSPPCSQSIQDVMISFCCCCTSHIVPAEIVVDSGTFVCYFPNALPFLTHALFFIYTKSLHGVQTALWGYLSHCATVVFALALPFIPFNCVFFRCVYVMHDGFMRLTSIRVLHWSVLLCCSCFSFGFHQACSCNPNRNLIYFLK